MKLTEGEYAEWYRNPVTQEFILFLTIQREEIKSNWSSERYVDSDDIRKSDRLNVMALTEYRVLGEVIEKVEEARSKVKEKGNE